MKPSAFGKVLPQRWMLFLRMDIKSAQILTWIYKSRHFPVQSEMFLSDSKNTVNTGKYATQYETCVFLLLKLSHQDDRTHLKRHTCPESYTPALRATHLPFSLSPSTETLPTAVRGVLKGTGYLRTSCMSPVSLPQQMLRLPLTSQDMYLLNFCLTLNSWHCEKKRWNALMKCVFWQRIVFFCLLLESCLTSKLENDTFL